MTGNLGKGKRSLWSSVGCAQILSQDTQAPHTYWGALVQSPTVALGLASLPNTLICVSLELNNSLITHQISSDICKSPVAQWSPRPTVTA